MNASSSFGAVHSRWYLSSAARRIGGQRSTGNAFFLFYYSLFRMNEYRYFTEKLSGVSLSPRDPICSTKQTYGVRANLLRWLHLHKWEKTGLSRETFETIRRPTTRKGTMRYISPNQKADISWRASVVRTRDSWTFVATPVSIECLLIMEMK